MATTVITTTDKAKRDDLFRQLRASDDPYEKQVVKFSGSQPKLNEFGEPDGHYMSYTATGKGGKVNVGAPQYRPDYESTWSVAYPEERT
ncbi:MAG TPA: hypothetical protein VMH89_10515 [Candidatus Acidoferrum sp.]|nr:hypothetical protein [Candidatus Acidoferrum sp.]